MVKSLKKTPLNKVHHDLKARMMDFAGCDFLTVGQYLPPSLIHHKVVKFVPPEKFEEYDNIGRQLGFRHVVSGSLVRSSFHAAETYLLAAKKVG